MTTVEKIDLFILQYFDYIIGDIAPWKLTEEEIHVGEEILNQKNRKYDPLLKYAIALTIKAIENRIKGKNPFTNIVIQKNSKAVIDKVHEIKKRKSITVIKFDDIQFKGEEIEILFGKNLKNLRVTNSTLVSETLNGIKKNKTSGAYFNQYYGAHIDNSLQQLGIKETTPIILQIFYKSNLIAGKASVQTIKSHIIRGRKKYFSK